MYSKWSLFWDYTKTSKAIKSYNIFTDHRNDPRRPWEPFYDGAVPECLCGHACRTGKGGQRTKVRLSV